MLKTYLARGGKHVSSNGNVNYMDRMKADQVAALHATMQSELGEHVIVDGDDDWGAPETSRPQVFARKFQNARNIEPLAYYHSGISGITKSGVVFKPDDFDTLNEWFANEYGMYLDENPRLKLTFNSDSTAC